jgi:hypothetical protein
VQIPINTRVATGLLLAGVALPGCGASGGSADSTAVKAVTLSLFQALEHGRFATACDDYTLATQTMIAAAAREIAGPASRTCAASLTVIARTTGSSGFAGLGSPTFTRISIAAATARVSVQTRAPHAQIAHITFTVVRQDNGWKVDRASSLVFSPTT